MTRSTWMAAGIAAAVITIGASAAPSHADEWSKTYKVSGRANLRVETDDGDVNIVAGDSNQIEARVTTDGLKIGPSDVRVEEHQEGDNVTVSVKMPHFNFSFFGGHHRSVRIDLRVPKDLSPRRSHRRRQRQRRSRFPAASALTPATVTSPPAASRARSACIRVTGIFSARGSTALSTWTPATATSRSMAASIP